MKKPKREDFILKDDTKNYDKKSLGIFYSLIYDKSLIYNRLKYKEVLNQWKKLNN
jgi:hypothetical protein